MANQINTSSETEKTTVKGHCVCNKLRYSLDLDFNSGSDAASPRTTLCHCQSCRRAFGTNYGLTAKVPVQSFHYEEDSGQPRKFKQRDTGVTREFCDNCGAYICEYGVREQPDLASLAAEMGRDWEVFAEQFGR